MAQEKIALIDLIVPDVKWIAAEPERSDGVPCAIHLTNLYSERPSSWLHEESNACGGSLMLYGSQYIQGKPIGPIKAQCNRCGFNFDLADRWSDAILEWMLMTFSSALSSLSTHKDAPKSFDNAVWYAYESWYSLSSFRPETTTLDPVLWKWMSKSSERTLNLTRPAWQKRNLVIANVKGVDIHDSGAFLALFGMTALLLRRVEASFQESIKKSAAISSSVSEMLHPTTRRK